MDGQRQEGKQVRAFMLRRGKNGNYCLRVRIRRAPSLTPERYERGLSTRDGREAWFRARVLLRLLADLGMLAGWSGEKFIADEESRAQAQARAQKSPRKNACQGSGDELKQGTLPLLNV